MYCCKDRVSRQLSWKMGIEKRSYLLHAADLQGKEPAWLKDYFAEDQRHSFSGPVLLTGKLDSPNPTHQVAFCLWHPATQDRHSCCVYQLRSLDWAF